MDLKIFKIWQKIIILVPMFTTLIFEINGAKNNNVTIDSNFLIKTFIIIIIIYIFMWIIYYTLIYKPLIYKIYKTNKHFYYFKN